jgi:uncharacterized membrane protein YcaP (DUF421 family)
MNVLDLDLSGIFEFTVSPLQLVLRGTLMYWFLFAIFRFILRRDVGSVGVSDFLFVVILGDAAQNAMIGSANSATDGMVLSATLVFWNYMLDFLSFRYPAIERMTSPRRLCLVRDGRRLRRNMRREYITDGELNEKLREAGIEDIGAVKLMFLEADGEMRVIKHEGGAAKAPA